MSKGHTLKRTRPLAGCLPHLSKSIAVSVVLLALTGAQTASIDVAKATAIKAAYLRHITALTTWPAEKAGDAGRPMVFGILGSDPTGVVQAFQRYVVSEEYEPQGRPLEFVDLNEAIENTNGEAVTDALRDCDVLFLSAENRLGWAERIRPRLNDQSIVTISEMEGFTTEGGMIEYAFDFESAKPQLIVNIDVVRSVDLTLSAFLLSLSTVIIVGNEEKP